MINVISTVVDEFTDTIRKTATIQGFIDWIDSILIQNVMLDNNTNQLELGKQLTLEWNWIGIRLLKIITENNAKFFGK